MNRLKNVAREILLTLGIVSAGIAAFDYGQQWWASRAAPAIQVGAIVSFALPRAGESRYLIVATSKRCPYSRASVAFHQRVIDYAKSGGIPVVLVELKDEDSPEEIRRYAGPNISVQTVSARRSGIVGTPTVALVEAGRVSGLWKGKLNASQERAMLGRLGGNSLSTLSQQGSKAEPLELGEQDLRTWLAGGVILDTRDRTAFERKHFSGALNIPEDELGARMSLELPSRTTRIVLDCGGIDSGSCSGDAQLLKAVGKFRDVWLLNQGAVSASCSVSHLST